MYKLTVLTPNMERLQIKVRSADELASVKRKLFEDKYSLIREEEVSEKLRSRRFNAEELLLVTKVFQTITSSSIPVVKGLDVEIEEATSQKEKDFFVSVKYQLESGHGLSDSLRNSDFYFTPLYLGMVSAGEKSGQLGQIFGLLHGYLRGSNKIARELTNAAITPVILCIVALFVFSFAITVVIPQFSELFGAYGKRLPLPTLIVIDISQKLKSSWLFLLGGLVILVVSGMAFLRNPNVVGKMTSLALRIPVLKVWISDFFIYRFVKVLSIQLSGGESHVKALSALKDLYSRNTFFTGYITKVANAVEEGKPLSKAMKGPLKIGRAIQYISLGEQSGKTSAYLDEASVFYEERVNQRVVVLERTIQPILLTVVFSFILAGLISVLLPVFSTVNIISP